MLEEQRQLLVAGRKAIRSHVSFFRQSDDRIHTFWHDPARGFARLITWPIDKFFKRSFNGRNLAHRMWVTWLAVRYFKPDVVVCSDGFSYAIPAALLKRFGFLHKPLVVSYIGGDILDCPEADVGKRRTPLVTYLIRQPIQHADTLRAVSPLIREALCKELAEKSKIQICPSHLVADQSTLRDIIRQKAERRESIRNRYGIPESATVIITLSGNQKGKGLQTLAECWDEVKRSIGDCYWLLCGPQDPWLERCVLPKIRQSVNSGAIILSGKLNEAEVFDHLVSADLHVNPSLCESLNMVTVEAASVGTSTVTSDGAGVAAWVSKFNAGCVVPAEKVDRLANAIISGLKDKDQLAAWQKNCEHLAAEFALDHIAKRLINIFSSPGKSQVTLEPECH